MGRLLTSQDLSSPNQQLASGGPRTILATSFASLEPIRQIWEALPVENLDADYHYFTRVICTTPGVEHPCVLLLDRPGYQPILVVGRVERRPTPIRIGYLAIARPLVRTLVVSFEGVLGANTQADGILIAKTIRRVLKDVGAKCILFQKPSTNSPVMKAISDAFPPWLRACGIPIVNHWTVELPDSLDHLLSARSARSRKRQREKERRLQRIYDGSLVIRRFENPTEFGDVCAAMNRVSSRTYQFALGAGAATTQWQREYLRVCLEFGWVKAWVLYISDKPVAFWWGTSYRGRFSTHTPGYDPDFSKDDVGTFTMMTMLSDLCADGSVRRLDLGHGDADYKKYLGSTVRTERDVFLFAPTPGSLMLAVALSLTGVFDSHVVSRIASSAIGRRLKKWWRKRLASRTASVD